MMRAIRKRVNGQLMAGAGHRVLRLAPDGPPLFLRFAFVRRGTEEHILPAFILDDWGTEIRKLQLYEWVRDHGELFPRAELFGFDLDGSEAQCFLREMELYVKYPCYVYPSADAPIEDGRRLDTILWADPARDAPSPGVLPPDIPYAMRRAAVRWWAVPLETAPGWLPPRD